MDENSSVLESSWPSASESCDPYTYDLAHYSRLLHENSNRLFVDDAELWIKVIEIGKPDQILKTFLDLESYLKSSSVTGTRMILVPQRFSWDHLLISKRAFQKLLAHFKVFPAIVDVVQAFGGQTSSESDSAMACHSHVRGNISEYCYITKIVEQHGREDSVDPWSIRQMGIYHQRDAQLDSNTFIIFNPSKTFQQRLRDAQAAMDSPPTWKDIHMLVASCSTTPWRRYISYMESQLAQLKTKAHLSTIADSKGSKTRPELKIEFEDTQNIQVVHDKLHRVNHIFNSHLEVFEVISGLLSTDEGTAAHIPASSEHHSNASSSGLNFCTAETKMQSQRLKTLFERINAASGLMQNIIDFRGLEALKISSAMSTEISRLAQDDNKLMLIHAEKSQRDARTLAIITIFTLIYLPASFVSFLSMGYIDLSATSSHVTLRFASELWIFGIMTIVLLAVTLGSWKWLEMRSRRAVKRGDCETVGGGN